jgi:hypothetical protein
MRAYPGRIRISRQCRLMMSRAVVSLMLVILWPSVGAAIPLLPGETSGEFSLGVANTFNHFGGGRLSTPAGDSIGFGFSGFRGVGIGSTGAGLNDETQAFSVFASVTHAGQSFFPCGGGFPSTCAVIGNFSAFMQANLPPPSPLTIPPTPFTGPSRLTVAGTFSLSVGASVYEQGGFGPFVFALGGDFFGPASLTFDAILDPPSPSLCADRPEFCGIPLWRGWEFDSGLARIEPTPEPTTLLLLGTTAAGLGFARWYRRRAHERAHAA